MRLFVAVFPPDDVLQDLHRRLTSPPEPGRRPAGKPAREDRKPRLTATDRWHVTLAFLGEVPPDRLPEVERALAAVAIPRGTPLCLHGGGQFGRGRKAAALWAGVDGDLAPLHARIREQLEAATLPYDDRAFTPHLTVSYAGSPAVRAALDGYRGPTWTLHEIALVRSDPHEGYTVLKTF